MLLSVPVAHWLDMLTIWQLYAVGFAVGVGTVFFDLAYQSYLPRLVERADLVEKREARGEQVRRAGGGARPRRRTRVGADGARRDRGRRGELPRLRAADEPDPERRAGRGPRRATRSLFAELREGLGYVFRHPYQRAIVATTAISNFFGQLVFAILLVFAVRELGLSAAAIGLIISLGSVGTLLAAVTARRVGDRLGVGRTVLVSSLIFGPATLLIAFAPDEHAAAFIVAAIALVGYGGTLYNVTMISLIQAITPDRILGRANVAAVRRLGGDPARRRRRGRTRGDDRLRETIVVGRSARCSP